MTTLLPNGKQVFLDANGVPLAGGSVFFYVPSTTTFKATFQDAGQVALNTNPVVLDSAGRAIIYGSGVYRQQVYDNLSNLIWDQLTASTDAGGIYSGGVSTGTAANQVVAAVVPAGFALTTGNSITFIAGFTSTGPTTLNANGTGAKAILKWGPSGPIATVAGDIAIGSAVELFYDGTQYQIVSPTAPPIPVLTNTRLAKTAAYPVVNADKGLTIALGGSAFYTLSFGAASGYDANFMAVVLNEDTTHGKTISLTGGGAFILWPLQSCIVFNSNNTWHADPPSQRWVLPGSTTFYVDPVNGLDTNDGLAAGAGNALQHIQAAENLIKNKIDDAGQSIIVQLATGTYNENVIISSGLVGGHVYTIHGDNATPANCNINGGGGAGTDCIFVTDYGAVTLDGVQLVNAGANCVHVTQFGIVDIKGNTTFSTASVHVLVSYLGRVNFTGNYKIVGNAVNHLQCTNQGSASYGAGLTVDTTAAPAFTTFAQITGGEVDCSGVAVTFTTACVGTKYAVALNGVLQLSGTVFPGGVAGGVATGGQAIP